MGVIEKLGLGNERFFSRLCSGSVEWIRRVGISSGIRQSQIFMRFDEPQWKLNVYT